MKLLLLFIFMIFADEVFFQTCSQNPIFLTKSIDLTPIKPKAGDSVVITISGEALQQCESGKLESLVSLKNVPVFEYHYDLCQISKQKCPVEKGDWTGIIHQLNPRFAFAGTYLSKSIAKDNIGNILTCVEFNFTISR